MISFKLLINPSCIELGFNIKLTISDGINTVLVDSDYIVEESKSMPTTKNDIIKQVTKLGNTVYSISDIDVDLDENVFIPVKALNDLRRLAIEEMNLKRLYQLPCDTGNYERLVPNFEVKTAKSITISSLEEYQNIKDDIAYLMNNNDYNIDFYEKEFGSLAKLSLPDIEVVAKNACLKAKFIYETKEEILNKIKEEELEYLFNDIEMPLSYVLADMELTGIKVNCEYLEKVQVELKEKMEDKEHEIYKLAGSEFNIMSPMQLAKVLFEDLAIPYPKKI